MRSISKVTDILLWIMGISSLYKANWEPLERYKERPRGDQRTVDIRSRWVQNSFMNKVEWRQQNGRAAASKGLALRKTLKSG